MNLARRTVLCGTTACAASFIVGIKPALAAGFSVADWIDLSRVIGEVADGLDKAINTIQHGAGATLSGFDVVSARMARNRLSSLSATLSDLHASQSIFLGNVDVYGDVWRKLSANGSRALNPLQIEKLQRAWKEVLLTVGSTLDEIKTAFNEMKVDRADFSVSKAYLAIADALEEKIGILSRLERTPAPLDSYEIQALVDSEKNFIRLRATLKNAIGILNSFIQRH